jgi:uncharacterized Tic20 family protein
MSEAPPPDSSGAGFGDPSPRDPKAPPPPQWGAPPSARQAPPPGYYPPPGQYPNAPPPPWGPTAFALSPQQERTWAMFAHIGAIIAGFLPGMAFLGPLVVMLTQGTKSPFVRRHAVESLNFQLTVLIALIAGFVVSVVLLVVTLGLGLLVFIPVFFAGFIAALIFTVIGGVKANNGEDYRYPINIRMVK